MKSMLAMIVTSTIVFGLFAWQTKNPSVIAPEPIPASVQEPRTSLQVKQGSLTDTSQTSASNTKQSEYATVVASYLEQGKFRVAVDYINQHYSTLSSDQLEGLKNLFIYSRDGQSLALERLSVAARLFDDLASWSALAQQATSEDNWEIAHQAMLRVSQLESRPTELEESLQTLVRSSSYLRAARERYKDIMGIRELYMELYQTHPWYPRFQLELAHAQAMLGDFDAAQPLYRALRYDPEYGAIAAQSLAYLEQSTASTSAATTGVSNVTAQPANQILVPLTRTGTSLLINTVINGQSTPLLLDTGASITALSSSVIRQLGLKSTGRRIRITTANGAREADLFFAETMRFGAMQLSNIEVAEIDLAADSIFAGLLGTDALSAFNQDFNYVIDQRQNALLFTPR